ncbi:DeoR/GlpR family DNA-binding transcription regulator [Bacillus sp. FJAT-50079]|uniref:DeoR/GlpR family DNA-binding transcription regulator n=1 Tax=Bacillus sp. FJAT-50079 TaxID=2833577 RepID=UPI001BCA3F38|nr:DeoR/GlpR family DNA-binding transcription regulator [Bacillus sp. FJAT-50079]MBS4207834.1 DeoR/GlpR transcriptional regulator [Bacillus sp. FJAT-50079]
MLAAERHRKIVELVNERSSIRVSELSKAFSVTEETIRRDLEKLEKAQQLRRSHGGAVSIVKDQQELPYTEREIMNAQEKKRIALEAVKYIEMGDQIVLDASTTAWYMARELPNMPLTVLTNSMKVATELSVKDQVKVISTGGMLLAKSLSFGGPLAERSLEAYHVDKAFISCKGVDAEKGLSDSNEWQALVKKKMIDIATTTILLVDSSKFGLQTFMHIAKLHEIDTIISDTNIERNHYEAMVDQNVPIILV